MLLCIGICSRSRQNQGHGCCSVRPGDFPSYPFPSVGQAFPIAPLPRDACASSCGGFAMLSKIGVFLEAAVAGRGVKLGCTLQSGQLCLFWDVREHGRRRGRPQAVGTPRC